MEFFKKLAKNKIYNITVNSLILISLTYLVAEKFIFLPAGYYRVLLIIDTVILSIFLVDFLVRLAAGGRHYFIKDYGWVDLLAVSPLLVPFANVNLVKGLRIMRTARFLRMMRIFRLIKLFKGSDSLNMTRQKVTLPAVSAAMIMVVVAGSLMINTLDRTLKSAGKLELESILDEAAEIADRQEQKAWLESKPQVVDVIPKAKLPGSKYSSQRFRKIYQVGSLRTQAVILDSSHHARTVARVEGWLYVITFVGIAILQLILSSIVGKALKSEGPKE